MSGKGTLDLVERLTNECIDVCQAVLRGRKYLGPLLDPSFRTQKLQRAVNEQKTAVGEMEMAVDRIMTSPTVAPPHCAWPSVATRSWKPAASRT
jgi:hypothetical protein